MTFAKNIRLWGTLCLAGIAAMAFAVVETRRAGAQGEVTVDALMQSKLASSQALLKGLALDDYELIQREAQRLQLLSLDTSWHTIQTQEYARISGEFREAAKKIRAAGEQKNLDAAGLGYFQLTMTCIDCHRHVRNVTK